MKKISMVNIIGIATALIGIGLGFVNDWVDDKKMEEMVEEKINEALAKREKED